MRLFICTYCSNVVYFENRTCERCDNRLGYVQARNRMHAVEFARDHWRSFGKRRSAFRFCENAKHEACNWLIAVESADTFCAACRHNQVIPDLSIEDNLRKWRKWELAKHHLFYGLLRLRLPLETRLENLEFGLAFDVLADDPEALGEVVRTGHQNGIIALNLDEADDAIREARRT
jgi:hypothetical protein